MIIPCSKIADSILNQTKKIIKEKGISPRLAIYYVGNNSESLSFIRSKIKAAQKIGASCSLIHHVNTPNFITFVKELQNLSDNPDIHGIVVQLPLPLSLATDTYSAYIHPSKDVEGIHPKSTVIPPVGLSVLTILAYHFIPGFQHSYKLDIQKHPKMLSVLLRQKKIVIIGKGKTGGKPIAETFTTYRIGYLTIHRKTPHPQVFLKEADVVISAVGKRVLLPEYIKPGALLMSVGLHKENGKWVGDYDEKQINSIASAYTTTPNGVGKLTVAYLFHNLVKLLDK